MASTQRSRTSICAGKKALIRVDFNVPIKNGDDRATTRGSARRCRRSSTRSSRARRVILMSHLGRPKGKPNPEYSLQPVADAPGELLGRRSSSPRTASGRAAKAAIDRGRRRAASSCSRTCASTPEEEKNDAGVRASSWPSSATSTSTTRSDRRTARTRRPKAIVASRQGAAAGLLMADGARVPGRGARATRSGRSSRSSAAPRCRTRSK